MNDDGYQQWSRRQLLCTGAASAACALVPGPIRLWAAGEPATAATAQDIDAVVRPEMLFAGLRQPISKREELAPRIELLEAACGDSLTGPLTHIIRFDTPVEGLDSELGFPVSAPVKGPGIVTHPLRQQHCFRRVHHGPVETLRETTRTLYQYMNTTGLSPELELIEVYPDRASSPPFGERVEVYASFLAWPQVYRAQLERVLGPDLAAQVWRGGEQLTPHTPVDPRAAWVADSLERLKSCTTAEQQFDILSRVALVRPRGNVDKYKAIADAAGGDVNAVLEAQHAALAKTRTGGFVDPPRFDGKVLHLSKVPYDGEAWRAATTPREVRQAYCFCSLVRNAENPRIDPIFCYRAAGWARQLWEPILGVEFSSCTITHSILKGDRFCAWDYRLPSTGHVPKGDDAPSGTGT